MVTFGTQGATNEGTVFLGDGAGGFQSVQTLQTTGVNAGSIEIGDVNNDGVMDLITSGAEGGGPGEVSIFIGDGDGTFTFRETFTAHTVFTFASELADFNSDGNLDLVVVGDSGPGEARIYLGDGTGSFSLESTVTAEAQTTTGVAVGDFNGDGVPDFITRGADGGGTGQSNVFLGNGDGTFNLADTFSTTSSANLTIEVADFNNDGNLDMVTGGLIGGVGSTMMFFGNGDGTFSQQASFTSNNDTTTMVDVGDFDGDGNLDIATFGSHDGASDAAIFLGDGEGGFTKQTNVGTTINTQLGGKVADINNDGVLDLMGFGHDGAAGEAVVLLADTQFGVAPILEFNLSTLADARQAIPMLDRKLTQLSEQRGGLGAFESRLSSAIGTLQSTAENLFAAQSRIVDADVASEVAELTRLSVLREAGTAVLAQANLQSGLVISLLSAN